MFCSLLYPQNLEFCLTPHREVLNKHALSIRMGQSTNVTRQRIVNGKCYSGNHLVHHFLYRRKQLVNQRKELLFDPNMGCVTILQ